MLSVANYKFIISTCTTEDGTINDKILDVSSDTALDLFRCGVLYGDTEGVEALVNSNVDVNYRENEKSATPLMLAVNRKYNDIAKCLIKGGANVNATMENNWTTLLYAVHNYNNIIISHLVDNDVDVNIQTNNKETALMWAVALNNSQIVDLLIKAGANIDAQSKDGFTALMLASQNDNKIIAKQLVDAGADVKLTNNSKENAFIIALKNEAMCTMNFIKQFYSPGELIPTG
jgi:ankyrin repeat protein